MHMHAYINMVIYKYMCVCVYMDMFTYLHIPQEKPGRPVLTLTLQLHAFTDPGYPWPTRCQVEYPPGGDLTSHVHYMI